MNILTEFLESLKQTTESISESTANKKSSESLEDTLQKVLINNGLLDLTADLELCHKGEINYFSNATTKSARKTQWGVIKNYINDYGPSDQQTLRKDLNGMFPANCFIRHPNGSQNHIDFLIIINGWMLYWEIKTGGGLSGKLNDRPIPAQFFVLSCSRHKEAKDLPFTWFQMGDIMSNSAYKEAGQVEILINNYKKELQLLTGKTEYLSKASLRAIYGWGKSNNDWYRKTINSLDRATREQKVLDLINSL